MVARKPAPRRRARPSNDPASPIEGLELPVLGRSDESSFVAMPAVRVAPATVAPRRVGRGVVVFDLDGTILDDLSLISHVASDVLQKAFGTPPEEGRIHYLATTGMPFEAQLAQLYPGATPALRASTARTFHQRKIAEAYAHAGPFPEIPKLLKRLDREGWTMVISTGAEAEMADLMLEREGLRYWFEDVLGSKDGTKREHLIEYRRRYVEVPIFLVGDSRFDMEAVQSVPGAVAVGRASTLHGWALTPVDLRRWGAAWADYSLTGLPEALAGLEIGAPREPVLKPKKHPMISVGPSREAAPKKKRTPVISKRASK